METENKTTSELEMKRFCRPFELKSASDDGTFSGYLSIFNNKDAYGDVVIPGAFANTLKTWAEKGKLPALLWQHDARQPIGVFTSMVEDDKGLFVEGRLVLKVQQAAEAYALLKAGAIDSMSIGYYTKRYEIDKEQNLFKLLEIDLWEGSLVTFPANDKARIEEVKQILGGGTLPGERVFEKFLRDVGFSKDQSKAIISVGFRTLRSRRDADDQHKKEIEESLTRLRTTIES